MSVICGLVIALMLPALLTTEPLAEPPDLQVTLVTAPGEAVVGAPITWRLTASPGESQIGGPVMIESGDERAWAWPDGPQTIPVLTTTEILELIAVPLVSGHLTPVVEVYYTVGGQARRQLVTAGSAIQVLPVDSLIRGDMAALQDTVAPGASLPVEFWIDNGSPFTLTVRATGAGSDLKWKPWSGKEVAPGATMTGVISATVEGDHPLAQINVEVAWTDAMQDPYTSTIHLSGTDIALAEGLLSRIPAELVIGLTGVLTGLLSAILLRLFEECLKARSEKKQNRRRVYSLLESMATQAKYAADSRLSVDLTPIMLIYQEKGLFATAIKAGLKKNVEQVLVAGQWHNSSPSHLERAQKLRQAGDALQKQLEQIATGWFGKAG